MDPHSLKVLEFDRVKEALSERISCGLGQHFVNRLEPSGSAAVVRARMAETTECRKFLDVEGRLPFGGLNDCTGLVREAAAGGMLRAEDLLQLAESLDAMRRLRHSVTSRAEQYPLLSEIAARIGVFAPLMQRIQHCIGERAEVLDRASTELARIRSTIGVTRARLGQRLEAVLRNSAYKLMIQDPVLVQRAGRTCIPIKLEYRTQFPGLVHDQSSSGQTVFMEPTEALEVGNEVRRLELDEETEIQRILQELSGAVGSEADGIRESLAQAGILDFINARAAYSQDTQAMAPVLSESGLIVLVKARHPLLGDEVVPLDLELNNERRTVVITGPNTGGKTVALKTTGLLALMA
ncbi:MAG: endonuclease MutS2, partial [Chloroflexi bacterium]|nr:endonuclease MutS2 [Chloroflexota bacterium]